MRPNGTVSVSKITKADGSDLPLSEAVSLGIITPKGYQEYDGEVVIGENLFLDQGRQAMAYCMGFKAPISNYVVAAFGVGTGTTSPSSTDTSLEAPVAFSSGLYTQPIDGVDFLTPFVMRVSYTIGLNDCNGYALTERGLFTGAGILIARQVTAVPLVKTSDIALSLVWRVRF